MLGSTRGWIRHSSYQAHLGSHDAFLDKFEPLVDAYEPLGFGGCIPSRAAGRGPGTGQRYENQAKG